MKMGRKSLALGLVVCMLVSMLSGMSLTAFADGEVLSTDEIIASSYTTASEGIEALEVIVGEDTVNGIQGLVEGEMVEYDGITFSGNERFLDVMAVTQHGDCWYFEADVYVDSVAEESKIAEIRVMKTGSDSYARVGLFSQVEAGVHNLIFVGMNPKARGTVEETCTDGSLSGLVAFQFADAKSSLDVSATTEVIASDYTEASEGIIVQPVMYFPDLGEDSAADGIRGLLNGNWAAYAGITFTGDEVKLSLDYATGTDVVRGNVNVYVDSIAEENLIVEARELDGARNGWATAKNYELTLLKPVTAGEHTVIFEGLENTPGPKYVEGAWNTVVAGMRSFKFIEGDWSTISPVPVLKDATEEFLALQYDSSSYAPGEQNMYWNGVEVYAASDLKDNKWLKFDNIKFTGNEVSISTVYMHQVDVTDVSFNVYLDSIDEANLIASADKVDIGTGWGGPGTYTIKLAKPITGSHSVIIEGLPLTVHDPVLEGETYKNEVVAFYSFTFVEGNWGDLPGDTVVTKPASSEFIASEFDKVQNVGLQDGMFFPGQEETKADGIANLLDGHWVRYDNVAFSGYEKYFSFDYATKVDLYTGNFDVYVNEISDENLIASARDVQGGEWNWPTVRNSRVELTKQVDAGTYSVIIVGLEPTVLEGQTKEEGDIRCGLRSFRFIAESWAAVSDANGASVDLTDAAFAWNADSDYTFKVDASEFGTTAQLVVALYDTEGRLIAVGLSEAGSGELSATLRTPADADLSRASVAACLWEAGSMMPLKTAYKLSK